MRYLLDALYLAAAFLAVPLLRRKSRRGLWGRFLGRTGFACNPSGSASRVWFHGVSVGEIHLLRNLVREFRRRCPEAGCVVSSTTDTGFLEAQRCFPDLPVIRWPFDFSWAVERTLSEVRPDLIVLAEGEWWPNLLLAARRRRIPVIAVNVRVSPRSLARYRRFRSLARRWLRLITHFSTQSVEYAAALHQLGVSARRISVTGSVKYDGLHGDRSAPKTAELRRVFQLDAQDIVWIAGSTQAPEEDLALNVYERLRPIYSNLRLILVPRQRERFDAVAQLLENRGISFERRSALPSRLAGSATARARPKEVILLDTIGELNAAWGLADIAFVGGSLDGRRGGQNMIEPAAFGAAVLFGPHTWNFRDTVRRLLDAQAAVEVHDEAELEATLRRWLADPADRIRSGDAARRLVRAQQGATDRTLDILDQLVNSKAPSPPPTPADHGIGAKSGQDSTRDTGGEMTRPAVRV